MKKIFLLCILVALCSGGATRVLAQFNPGERFLDAFFLIQDGDAAQAKSDWTAAYDKYSAALKVLQEIKAQAPDWNTRLVDYRTGYCSDHLEEIKPKLPQPSPRPPRRPHPRKILRSSSSRMNCGSRRKNSARWNRNAMR